MSYYNIIELPLRDVGAALPRVGDEAAEVLQENLPGVYIYIYIYVHTYVYTHITQCIYIYIYIHTIVVLCVLCYIHNTCT